MASPSDRQQVESLLEQLANQPLTPKSRPSNRLGRARVEMNTSGEFREVVADLAREMEQLDDDVFPMGSAPMGEGIEVRQAIEGWWRDPSFFKARSETHPLPSFAATSCTICICGPVGSGKRSFLHFLELRCGWEQAASGILKKMAQVGGKQVEVSIVEAEENESAEKLKSYDGFALIYDITIEGSLTTLRSWFNRIFYVHKWTSSPRPVVMIGSHADLYGSRQVSVTEADDLATELEIPLIETSSELGLNVEESILGIAYRVYQLP